MVDQGEGLETHASRFPATTSTDQNHLRAVLPVCEEFLIRELCAQRLHRIVRLLWLAGRPLPPRPLHQQLLMRRRIITAEPIELHLVWTGSSFFVKPLPRYLLDEEFSKAHVRSREKLVRSALGFLFSYTALVRYESDFHIAQEKRLLPPDLSWDAWQDFTHRFFTDHPETKIYQEIDERYWYGELRLGRLNKLYRVFPTTLSDVVSGYSTLTAKHQKSDVFSDNLNAIAATLAYLVIVLQAMQVGLTTDRLAHQESFQQVCYGVAVFSIVAPLAALGMVLVVFLFLLVANFTMTLTFEKKRFGDMGVTPPRRWKRKRSRRNRKSSPA